VNFLLPEELKDVTDTSVLIWGRIEDSSDETLRKHLKDDVVNLEMDQIEIIVDSETSATIKAVEGSLLYKGQITVYFVTEVIDLAEVFPEDVRNLGTLIMEDDDIDGQLLSYAGRLANQEHCYEKQLTSNRSNWYRVYLSYQQNHQIFIKEKLLLVMHVIQELDYLKI
jgi:hypothetical protein